MYKRIYLLGIGGIAMANLACLLKKGGILVSGSDMDTFGPSAELLKKNKIKYFPDHNPEHIKKFKPDMVVIGNAIKRGNVALEYLISEKLPYCSMPEIIRDEIINDKTSIVVAGTSGKTTTTSLTAWILYKSGLEPTALVGGIVNGLNSGFLNGEGDYVIVEGDEYNSSFEDSRPKFLHYKPEHAIITNVQMDHLDLYGSMENIVEAFKKLAKIIPPSGSLVLNKDNQYTPAISKEAKSKIITFGKNGDLEAKNIKYDSDGITFELISRNKNLGTIICPLLGNHNVENILASVAVGLNINIPFVKISKALSTFKGVKRRMEIIHQKNNVTIIDDFAHNPEKVAASISALKMHFPKHQIIAIFEPRTGSSRRKFFQDIYPNSFALADTVYIAEPYKKEALKDEEIFSHEQLVKELNKKGVKSYAFAKADEIVSHITDNMSRISKKPAVIIVMTSGEFDEIHQKLISLFK